MRPRIGRGRRDDGAVTIITVLVMSFVLMGLVSLVVDLGLGRDTRRQSQNAADAAALAAANVIASGGTVANAAAAAKNLAAKNYGTTAAEWGSCRDTPPPGYATAGGTQCISFLGGSRPGEVRVVVPTRQVVTPFAGIWGVSSVPVDAFAHAVITGAQLAPCGVCVVGLRAHDLQDGDIDVANASVVFNSTLSSNPGGSIAATGGGSINLEGTTPTQGTFSPAPNQNQPRLKDPLTPLLLPDYSLLMPKTDPCSQGPGIYGSFPVTSPCTLAPGLYVIYGTNTISGPVTIEATGVTLYFVCSTGTSPRPCASDGEVGGSLLLSDGSLHITAPTTGLTAGLAVAADRRNTAVFGWRGNGTQASTGTVYARRGTFRYGGNTPGLRDDSLIVVRDLDFDLNPALLQTTYTEANNVVIPRGSVALAE